MQTLFRYLSPAVALLFSACVFATEVVDRADLGRHFTAAGVEGTFAMLDVAGDRLTVSDRARANRRFVPASTFKIFNSLVALETGVVKDEHEIVPYGGKPQRFKNWEQDMSMHDAIRISNVPVYQELARRAGLARMRDYIKRAGYGNADIGHAVDQFWLDGSLAISAVEQASFLRDLVQHRLPFSGANIAIVRSLIKQEEAPGYTLFGKTGWAFGESGPAHTARPGLGWWIGWVERDGKVYTFALNIDIHRDEDAAKRQVIARECLKALGVL